MRFVVESALGNLLEWKSTKYQSIYHVFNYSSHLALYVSINSGLSRERPEALV